MIDIRPVSVADLDALYVIALLTGEDGNDASSLHEDGRLIGHVYAAPYAILSPETGLVAEDGQGVAGYIVGAFDTAAFEDRLERDWWPALRARHADPTGDPVSWNADQRYAHLIHHPPSAPPALTVPFPAHLHLNVLQRAQGRGIGAALLKRWLDAARQAGVRAVHLGTGLENRRAQAFWQSQGFTPLTREDLPPQTCWFGMQL